MSLVQKFRAGEATVDIKFGNTMLFKKKLDIKTDMDRTNGDKVAPMVNNKRVRLLGSLTCCFCFKQNLSFS